MDDLNQFLLEENHAGRIPVLVIDEAQNLSGDVLEQIRLLSNLETETEKLIQIVLAGQPELTQVLSRPELRQLNQRVAVRYRLTPLAPLDCREYICHRLKVAGRPDAELFSPAATRRVHRLTGGVPRLINLLCDRALLIGYANGIGRLTPREVSQASRELAQQPSGCRQYRLWWLTAAALGCAGVLGWFLNNGFSGIFQ